MFLEKHLKKFKMVYKLLDRKYIKSKIVSQETMLKNC